MARVFAVALGLSVVSVPAYALTITVKAATPSNAPQGTVNLDVLIDGSGFGGESPAGQILAAVESTGRPD